MDETFLTPEIVYLSLIGAVVLISLLSSYRRQLGKAAQHAIVWALVFGGALLLGGYEDELRAALQPKQAVLLEGEVIELRRASDGHFYAELDVNGAPVTFIIDTGASGIVLTREDALIAGIDPESLRYLGTANTANGSVAIAATTVDTLRLGPREDRDVRVSVNSGAMPDSLLGMAYLNRFQRIEFEGSRLRLTP
ncbi:MAG: TIGR02281 family clan AA aspartic protease [Pseudomonadota bacterium]